MSRKPPVTRLQKFISGSEIKSSFGVKILPILDIPEMDISSVDFMLTITSAPEYLDPKYECGKILLLEHRFGKQILIREPKKASDGSDKFRMWQFADRIANESWMEGEMVEAFCLYGNKNWNMEEIEGWLREYCRRMEFSGAIAGIMRN